MSKGYTLNYFINFFQSIPASRWTCHSFTNREELEENSRCSFKACALGYAGAYKVDKEELDGITYFSETSATTPVREKALTEFLPATPQINDGDSDTYSKLGKTPRTRILKALKLRKKYGPEWETKSKLFK